MLVAPEENLTKMGSLLDKSDPDDMSALGDIEVVPRSSSNDNIEKEMENEVYKHHSFD